MRELHHRGYSVFYADPSNLSASPSGITVKTRRAAVLDQAPFFFFHEEETLPIDRFRLVWIRKDPPVDAAYLYMTQILSLAGPRTAILNSPQALRDWNEKLIILNFPKWIPPTLVTSDKHELAGFVEKHLVAVLKPLAGFAGQGVRRIFFKQSEEMREQIDSVTHGGTLPVMAQVFFENVRLGEKRVFVGDGRVLGSFLKIPQDGGFLTNPDRGSRLATTSLTAREKKICAAIGVFLRKHGVFFAGLDLIDGHLTEINITSPGLLWEWNEIENRSHEKTIIDLVEKRFLRR